MVGHPVNVGIAGSEVAPVGAVANHGVTVGVQGIQVRGIPLRQRDAIGEGGGCQRDNRQVGPVVLEQLSGHQTAEGDADEHGASRKFGSYGENGGVIFLCRGGWEVEEGYFRQGGKARQQSFPEEPDGAVGTAAFAVEKEDVVCHLVLSLIVGNCKLH